MKKQDWRSSKHAEQSYLRDLLSILEQYFTDSEAPETHPDARKVKVLSSAEWIQRFAWQAAQRMIVGRLTASQRTWRAAARESMKGQLLYKALQQELQGDVGIRMRELIQENATLISSLPLEVAQRVNRMIAVRQQKGLRAVTAESLIPGVVKWKARLIARTEVSKATTALTQARAESLGLDYFIWETSQDQRVRRSHQKMQGVLVNWRELPSPEKLAGERNSPAPYAAGNIYNCRCYPAPLVRLEQVQWPHRTFFNGKIQYLTLAKFKQISNIQQPIAA